MLGKYSRVGYLQVLPSHGPPDQVLSETVPRGLHTRMPRFNEEEKARKQKRKSYEKKQTYTSNTFGIGFRRSSLRGLNIYVSKQNITPERAQP